ncbi:MAG: hypothetical protein JO211_09110, partial [Acidobacteriaceae bacterium]|nr:hypothetical protein [Acidobacteriaceae bacterium]
MTPEQFHLRIGKQAPAPAYLFVGQEGYERRRAKEALIRRVLPAESAVEGLTQVDLENTTLAEVLDDARSLSLFSSERLIWVCSAELALPRRLASTSEEGEERTNANEAALSAY